MISNFTVAKLTLPQKVEPGDTFKLSVDGKLVLEQKIAFRGTITHYASFYVGGSGLCYAVGTDTLERDLTKAFARTKLPRL